MKVLPLPMALTTSIAQTVADRRLALVLLASFAALALVLASLGVYSVMAHLVTFRTSEIGIRMALGAERRQVLVMILRETALLAASGVVIGIGAAVGVTRYVGSMLYGLPPSDPLSFGVAVVLLLAIALLAGWWPARKASRLDPMVALRHE